MRKGLLYPDRALLAVVVLNACCVLLFRCFLTLDGPVHVLHAGILADAIGVRKYTAEGLAYELSGIDLGVVDPIAGLLLMWLPPELVEAALAALALLMFGCGVLAYAKAYAREHRWLVLMTLPLSFSVLLVLGFFQFVFAIGFCLWAASRWLAMARVTRRAILLLLLAFVGSAFVHRGAPVLFGALIAVHEMLLFLGDRAAFNERWTVFPRKWTIIALALGSVLLTAAAVHYLFLRSVFEEAEVRDPWQQLVQLRSLLLLDRLSEQPFILAFAALLVSALFAAVVRFRRARLRASLLAPLALGLLFLLASLFVRTRWADLHYFCERAQLLGLLMLLLWVAVVLPNKGFTVALSSAALFLHIARTVQLERHMAGYEHHRIAVAQIAKYLEPGTIVAVFGRSDDWLLLHQLAHLAARHRGVVLNKRDKITFARHVPAAEALRHAIDRKPEDRLWLKRCAEDPSCPGPAAVIVFGEDDRRTFIEGLSSVGAEVSVVAETRELAVMRLSWQKSTANTDDR